jgi:4-amino-4-deoxy-L-arabinose transferase-like glycosyltransferase
MIKISLILFLACILLCWGIFLPYVKAWEVGVLELFAKNHLLYGLDKTKGIPVFNLIEGQANYYLSHPPLVPLLLFLSFKLFGVNEWSARLVSIIFSLIGLLFFYLLMEYISNKRIALFSSMFMCFMPMFSYYGRIVNYESVTLGLSLVFLYGFTKYIHTRGKSFLLIAIISAILGALSDWAFYLIILTPLIYIKGRIKNIRLFLGIALMVFAIGVGFILISNYLATLSLKTQLHPFFHRCQYKEFLFNPKFYQILTIRFLTNFTPLASLFLLIWLFRILNNRSLLNKDENLLASSLLIFGIILLFIVPQATYIHDWALQYLVPAIALISSLAIMKFKKIYQYLFILLFIIYSLYNLTVKHGLFRNYEPYEAGRLVCELASAGDVLYVNEISAVNYYAGVESRFFGGRGVRGKKEMPDEFIQKSLPAFVCIIKYAIEPRYNYDKIIRVLVKEGYKRIYDKDRVLLWLYRK